MVYDWLYPCVEGTKIRTKGFSWDNIPGRFPKLVGSELISTLIQCVHRYTMIFNLEKRSWSRNRPLISFIG
jgi:hypothetical protein